MDMAIIKILHAVSGTLGVSLRTVQLRLKSAREKGERHRARRDAAAGDDE